MSEDQRTFFMYEDRLYPTQAFLRERYRVVGMYLYWKNYDHQSRRHGRLLGRSSMKLTSESRKRSYTHDELLNILVTGHIHPRYSREELGAMYKAQTTEP